MKFYSILDGELLPAPRGCVHIMAMSPREAMLVVKGLMSQLLAGTSSVSGDGMEFRVLTEDGNMTDSFICFAVSEKD